MPEHVLAGCVSAPLAHYLKALGVLRLVSEQADSSARGAWRGGTFVLRTGLDRDDMLRFFLEDYAPSPIVTPWNGGSGFFPKDNTAGIGFVESSTADRLSTYRSVISTTRTLLNELGIAEKPDPKSSKPQLLEACRNRLPDGALDWLDAAYVLTGGDPKYPPLLGTGGNDGRLEFVNNFMQRLMLLFDAAGQPEGDAASWLRGSLLGEPVQNLQSVAAGQFQPGAAGGANAGPGYGAKSLVNPWDFVLMLEGSLLFAAAAVRRMRGTAAGGAKASFPFCVNATATGYASADDSEEGAGNTRGELWTPLWESFATCPEIRAVLGEGRAEVHGRAAADGLDFARAVSSLGVDRGLVAFERYGLHVRNGLSYFATHLGRIPVRERPSARLLEGPLDNWLLRNRRKVTGDRAPSSVASAFRRFESLAFALCDGRSDPSRDVTEAFLALGRLSAAIERSVDWALAENVHVFPELSQDWVRLGMASSLEARLGLALSSVTGPAGHPSTSIRTQFAPLAFDRNRWAYVPRGPEHVLRPGDLVGTLIETLHRRMLQTRSRGEHVFGDRGQRVASLGDITAFIQGQVDDGLLMDWLRACLLLEPGPSSRPAKQNQATPTVLYGLSKLCFAHPDLPTTPRIVRLAAAGRGPAAAQAAARRLRASGMAPLTSEFHGAGTATRRTAAALLFPISPSDLKALDRRFLHPREVAQPSFDPGATR